MKMTAKCEAVLGLILSMVGCIPAMIWLYNLVQSRATDSKILFLSIPFITASVWFEEQSRKHKAEKEM